MSALGLTLGLFVLLLIIRIPVAFAMLAAATVHIMANDLPVALLAQKVAGGVDKFALLAVPLFLVAGFLMNALGVTDRIFTFAATLVRSLPGGLAHVNVVASVIFAGMSGSIIADAGGLGVIEIKAMRRAGFRDGFSAAVTAASALIGPIIPPSIIMVVYAFVTEVSLGRLFIAGVVPGLLMALSMMVLIFFLAVTGRETCPQEPRATLAEVLTAMRRAVLPILAPVILVGGILSGYFTPTEAGVVAVLYVLLIGCVIMNFNIRNIIQALADASRTTAATLFILATAAVFTWIVATSGLTAQVAEFITSIATTPTQVLLVIAVLTVLLGMVMEGLPIMVIFGPIFLSATNAVGIDPVQLGIVFIMAMMIGGVTPPVGITLYVVMAIARVSLPTFMRSIWPFYLAILAVIGLLIVFPQLSLWLPDLLVG